MDFEQSPNPESSPELQRAFLRSEFHQLTRLASFQRSGIYDGRVPESHRRALKASLREMLEEVCEPYSGPVSDPAHLEAIVAISDRMSERHGSILRKGRFRIGIAQKALNLFLKYCWCAGWIHIPPHCPFDRIVIDLLPPADRVAWTKLDTPEEYEALVRAARGIAGDVPLAIWELEAYSRRQGAYGTDGAPGA